MSQENVEIVAPSIDAWNRGDLRRRAEARGPGLRVRHVARRRPRPWRVRAGGGASGCRTSSVTSGSPFGWSRTSSSRPATMWWCRSRGNGGTGRHRDPRSDRLGIHDQRRRDRAHCIVSGARGGPRSRRAGGVGDVAGERRDAQARGSKRSSRPMSMRSWRTSTPRSSGAPVSGSCLAEKPGSFAATKASVKCFETCTGLSNGSRSRSRSSGTWETESSRSGVSASGAREVAPRPNRPRGG